MKEIVYVEREIVFKDGYKCVKELKYYGVRNADGTIRVKSFVFKRITEKCTDEIVRRNTEVA